MKSILAIHPLARFAVAMMAITCCLASCQAAQACDGVAVQQLNTGCFTQALRQQVVVPQQYALVQQVAAPHYVQAVVQQVSVRQKLVAAPKVVVQKVRVVTPRVRVQRQRVVVQHH